MVNLHCKFLQMFGKKKLIREKRKKDTQYGFIGLYKKLGLTGVALAQNTRL